ncbi:MAG: RNA polymerase sigma factor [Sphingomonas sp.]|nr:RNA polymerase sigma factor [Sphingomonas sp.]
MIDLAACTDGELAALALTGRQWAYRALMDRHRAGVFRLARGQTGDDDAALDITQQSFIAAFAALRRYDGERPFRHWIARITLNKCRDYARRQKVRAFLSFALPVDAGDRYGDGTADVEQTLEGRQELARAMAAIARLPGRLKEVIVLRCMEELSQSETAQLLGISEKAVETRLYRARAKLSEIMRG